MSNLNLNVKSTKRNGDGSVMYDDKTSCVTTKTQIISFLQKYVTVCKSSTINKTKEKKKNSHILYYHNQNKKIMIWVT